jgi:hypothetical protein
MMDFAPDIENIEVTLAPIFGAFSKSMTMKIGREATKIFSKDIAIEKSEPCVKGHEVIIG